MFFTKKTKRRKCETTRWGHSRCFWGKSRQDFWDFCDLIISNVPGLLNSIRVTVANDDGKNDTDYDTDGDDDCDDSDDDDDVEWNQGDDDDDTTIFIGVVVVVARVACCQGRCLSLRSWATF